MPKRESKAKGWVEEVGVCCMVCRGEFSIMIETGAEPPKRKICDPCKERSASTSDMDLPEDWYGILGPEILNERPRRLSLGEIARLSKAGAITPYLPGALCCPAFGIFCINVGEGDD